ncbi:alpha/beta-hydrolase [Eremomyces bilateralis CBS 781.70]|uniref:Alpha/beta-hydrolase n=1 Tax=Eremomyces bilateralis CBS 781.70 TaxID=1392243 RepID=A0A6G1FVH5_9PEZI|nr:alpha/beta-hydrolase [Eremomyces bilateralis CBS 781.70]KAF1809649.1 alpha/beta-hydrolase [Eremomyces bilateralis CBS 781.70]
MKSTLTCCLLAVGVSALPSPQSTGPQPAASSPASSLTDLFPDHGENAVPFGPKPTGCSDFEVLVARGTSEPGPFGIIAGDPLVKNVVAAMPEARGYAVQYPAVYSTESVLIGAEDVVNRVTEQNLACPSQKFALVGYSQGARVMRAASVKFDPSIYPKILALVMFGDRGMRDLNITQFPPHLQTKLFENCAPADPGCSGVGTDPAPHLTYNANGTTYQADSARFIIAAFKGTPLPAKTAVPEASIVGGASGTSPGAESPPPPEPGCG